MNTLQIIQPDDWHIHLRDDKTLHITVLQAESVFGRVLAMPNLVPPLTTVDSILAYRERILSVANKKQFSPYFALYFTDTLTSDILKQAKKCPWILGVKLYPQGATTHSDWGVRDIHQHYDNLAVMEELKLPLLIHGEVTDATIDIFDREARFIETILDPLQQRFPQLPMVLEHITTKQAVEWILQQPNHIAATITVHHLLFNRNQLLVGGVRPDYYCLPILKRQTHQDALQQAVFTPGQQQFFLGTDSAPHIQNKKYTACGCAGCFTTPIALPLLAQLFAQHKQLALLEAFTSVNGARFYQLPLNTQKLKLYESEWHVPKHYQYDDLMYIPLLAGESLAWHCQLSEEVSS